MSSACRLLVAVVSATLMLAGCGVGSVVETQTPTRSPVADDILIVTSVVIPEDGDVLDESTIGGLPFCPAGMFTDTHGNDVIGLVDRTFRCADGTLRIGFTPGVPEGRTQAGPWRIVSGTGAYAGWTGGGEMQIEYEDADFTVGAETFTGTVRR